MKKLILTLFCSLLPPFYAHALDINVLAGVDTNKNFSVGAEGVVGKNYLLGFQANIGSADTYETGSITHSSINNAKYSLDRNNSIYSIYVGYKFTDSLLNGLSLKAGASQMTVDMKGDVYGTTNGQNSSDTLYDVSESKTLPFIGIGYQINDRLSVNVHSSLGSIETVDINGKSVDTDYNNYTTSILLGFTF
ncbi:hypothetical protein [Vibrio sp. ER1A]|uniref:hypothetical protein n=1 Tax=Vibrio sp. ER1A TaxID=1517681 RepID=UPI0004DD6C29|nr:hypothetical protein [Vibrio sp. ER1A]KFA99485.1 hypothetical protein HW45_03435 [Vibrio sp. ER1A]